mgnify:CR=1 FL=1
MMKALPTKTVKIYEKDWEVLIKNRYSIAEGVRQLMLKSNKKEDTEALKDLV